MALQEVSGTLRTAREAAGFADVPVAPVSARSPAEDKTLATGWVVWVLVFVSFVGMQSIQAVGTIGAVLFLVPWLYVLAPRITVYIGWLIRDWPLLLLPSLATLSALWSTVPAVSLRGGLEYGATVMVGILAARCVKPRTLVTAMMMGIAAVNAASLLLARLRGVDIFERAAADLYGSKNQIASYAAVQFLIAMSYALSPRETRNMRQLAWVVAGLGLIGFIAGRSAGTLVALLGACVLVLPQKLAPSNRWKFYAAGIPIVLCALVIVSDVGFSETFNDVLHGLGKNATLTGRTDLWQDGIQQIEDHFLLGTGNGGFWVHGNPVAERLWAKFGITNRGGFHFHSTFVNVGVDLGMVGGTILASIFLNIFLKSIKNGAWLILTPERAGVTLSFVIYSILMLVEHEFIAQFYLSTIIMCIYWGIINEHVDELLANPQKPQIKG
jgi:exopolysaccharide production protein ExoQ